MKKILSYTLLAAFLLSSNLYAEQKDITEIPNPNQTTSSINLENESEIQKLLDKKNEYTPKYDITVSEYLNTLKMNEQNKKFYFNLSKYYTEMVDNYNKESKLDAVREPLFMNTTCAIMQGGASAYEFMLVVLNLTLDKLGPDAPVKYQQAQHYIEKNQPNINPSFSKNCNKL